MKRVAAPLSQVHVRARRSVEVAITLGPQEAGDLLVLIREAREAAPGSELEGFYFDLELALSEGLEAEGVTLIQPRVIGRGGPPGAVSGAPATGGTLFSGGAVVRVPDVPKPVEDGPPKAVTFDPHAHVEPTQGLKPVFK